MTTTRLRSFLQNKHHDDSTSKPSLSSKKPTISFSSKPACKEYGDINARIRSDSPKRSSTFSKMKRFGSLLARSNSGSRHKNSTLTEDMNVPRIPPLTIDTSLSLKASSSSIASDSSSYNVSNSIKSTTDSEEENLVTPTQPDASFFNGSEKIEMEETKSNIKDTFKTTYIIQNRSRPSIAPMVTLNEDKQGSSAKIEIESSPITAQEKFFDAKVELDEGENTTPRSSSTSNSDVSLVRLELELAFKLTDRELEDEFDSRHYQMLQKINAKPIHSF